MAWLIARTGEKRGQSILLPEHGMLVIGRDESCDVAFLAQNVSRVHARIWRQGAGFLIEDEVSRNETLLNGRSITGKGPYMLHKGAAIRICDNEFEFQEEVQPKPGLDEGDSSTIEYVLKNTSKRLLQSQPIEKLTLLLEITTELTRTTNVNQIPPQVMDALFTIFTQADRGFLILGEDGADDFRPQVVRTRNKKEQESARFSRSLVRRCIESGEAFLCDFTKESPNGEPPPDSVIQSFIHSVMFAPLKGLNDNVHGAIQVDTRNATRKFTENDLEFLTAMASQAAIALENAAQARLANDLRVAHEIQRGFLPRGLPELPGYSFAARYESAQAVGGDYYDFVPLPGGRMAVMIGDVAGKGVSASLLMAKVSSAARYALLTEPSPAAAVAQLNRQMCDVGIHDKFVTLTAALIDPLNHTITFVNAGHNLPFLYTPTTGNFATTIPPETGGPPLGVLDEFVYEAHQIPFEAGASVLMYTDGVVDAQNLHDDCFEMDGIRDTLKDGPFTPDGMASQLLTAVESFSKGCTQFDDVTIVSFGRNP